MRLCLSGRAMSHTREFGLYLCSWGGSNSTLSPVVRRDIVFGINFQIFSTIQLDILYLGSNV